MTSGPEIFVNKASTTLAASYTAGAGSITVASTTSYGTGYGQFPSTLGAGQFFRVKVGTILMKVTAVNTSTGVWTATAVESTDANQGANVAVVAELTAGTATSFTQSGSITDSDINASAAISTSKLGTGEYAGTDFKATGLTGATAASRYVGATTAGAPTTGTFAVGDFVVDQTGKVWVCTTAGTPGTWTVIGNYTLPAAATAALGGVEIDKTPASGNPVALTAAGLTPASTAGAPTTGTYVTGELYIDSADKLYVCSAGGTPGTWVAISGGSGMTNPMTAPGDLIVGGAAGAPTRQAVGTLGQVLEITNGAPYLAAPAAPVPTTATTGGTIAAGTYGVEITYVNAQGESVASANGPITTTGTTSTITIPSPAAAGSGNQAATGWYAYVTQAGGSAFTRQQAAGSPTAIGTALTITAPPTSTGVAPPSSNTAGTLVPNWSVGATHAAITQPPVYSNWTWLNQGTASGGDFGPGVGIQGPVGSGSDAVHGLYVPLGKAAPYTVTAAFYYMLPWAGQNDYVGILLYDAATATFVAIGLEAYGPSTNAQHWNSATSFNANAASLSGATPGPSGPLAWLQISDDGTNRHYSTSPDGYLWYTFFSEASGTFSAPDHAGFFAGENSANMSAIRLVSWLIS